MHLAQLDVISGWLAGRQNAGKFQIFKLVAEFNEVVELLEHYEYV